MGLASASPRLPAQPLHISWGGSPRLVSFPLPHISKTGHYMDDIMLTCEDLPLHQDILKALLEHLRGREWAHRKFKAQAPPYTAW